MGLTKAETRSRYFYSGGCVRDFVTEAHKESHFVCHKIGQVPVLHERMKTLVDVTKLACYTALDDWIEVTASKYTMMAACVAAQPEYFQVTMQDWRRRMPADALDWHLLGNELKGYFHTLAFQKKKKLFLHVRDYEVNSGAKSTSASSDKVVQVVVQGPAIEYIFTDKCYSKCLETLRAWAETPTEREYWVPCVSEFEPVNAIVKIVRDNDQIEFWMLHLVVNPSGSEVIELNQQLIMEIAEIFGSKFPVRYVAVASGRLAQDQIRFSDSKLVLEKVEKRVKLRVAHYSQQ